MALISCPECSKEISDKAKSCPNCGFEINSEMTAEKSAVNGDKKGIGCFPIFLIAGVFLIFILIISGTDSSNGGSTSSSSSSSSNKNAWYSGGNLHSATVRQWRIATEANKLATSGDMAMVNQTIKARVMNSGNIDNGLPYARQMMSCIEEASGPGVPEKQKVSELAAACLLLLNWQ